VGDEGRRQENKRRGRIAPGMAAPLRRRGWPSGARDSAGVGVVGPGARRLHRRERLLSSCLGTCNVTHAIAARRLGARGCGRERSAGNCSGGGGRGGVAAGDGDEDEDRGLREWPLGSD